MAINYGNYAQIYGGRGGTDLSGFGDAISRAVEGSNKMRQMNILKVSNDWQESITKQLQSAAFGEIGNYRNYFSQPSYNAGTALKNYKDFAAARLGNGNIEKGMRSRAYLEMVAAGHFNPLQFKQQYDQIVGQYTPTIERKLEQFKDEKGLSDREFQAWMNRPEYAHLRNFMQDYGDSTGPSYAASKTYQPYGLIPGVGASFGEDPTRMAFMGPAYRAGFEGIRQGYGKWRKGTPMNLRDIGRAANPLNILPKDLRTRGQIAKQKGRLQSLVKDYGKKHNLLFGQDLEKGWQKSIKKNISNLGKDMSKHKDSWEKAVKDAGNKLRTSQKNMNTARSSYKEGLKKFTKNFRANTGTFGARSGLTDNTIKKMYNSTKEGAKLLKESRAGIASHRKLKTSSQKILSTAKSKYDTAIKSTSKAFDTVDSKLKKKVGTGATKAIQRYVQRHGPTGLVRLIASKVGKRQAMLMAGRLLAGGAITGLTGGLGAAAGAAINLYTLYDIGKLAAEALGETGGVRRPDKMLFGGK